MRAVDRAMRRLGSVILVAAVAGCASPSGVPIGTGANPETIPRQALVPAEPAVARARAEQVLGDLGFVPIEGQPGRFEGGGERTWAFCPTLTTRRMNRILSMRASARRTLADLAIVPVDGGTSVLLAPTFLGVYNRRDGAGTFEHVCDSFGVLETAFFDRLGEP